MEISLLWCHILWAKLFIASSFTLIVCLRLQSVIRLTIGSLALFQIHNNIPNIISTTASKATTTTITATTARTRTTARTTTTIHYRFISISGIAVLLFSTCICINSVRMLHSFSVSISSVRMFLSCSVRSSRSCSVTSHRAVSISCATVWVRFFPEVNVKRPTAEAPQIQVMDLRLPCFDQLIQPFNIVFRHNFSIASFRYWSICLVCFF